MHLGKVSAGERLAQRCRGLWPTQKRSGPKEDDGDGDDGALLSSGEWLVREGSEEEFIEAWTSFTEWSLENAEGAESFILVRSMEDPKKFLFLGAWESQQ